MIFRETALAGVLIVELEPHADERGAFARTWCRREAAAAGIDVDWVQFNLSRNRVRGTLRGMHYQRAPHCEAKLVRCTRGRIHDVVVDLRPGSPTRLQHVAVELDADSGRALFIPAQELAHGFLTLEDDTEVFYHMSAYFHGEAAVGYRWDDPAFGIAWPEPIRVASERDRSYADFKDADRG